MPKPTPKPNEVPAQISVRLPPYARKLISALMRLLPGETLTGLVVRGLEELAKSMGVRK